MIDVRHVLATPEHVLELSPRMRAADREELLACGYPSVEEALYVAIEISNGFAFACYFDDQLAFLWGAAPEGTKGVGVPWLLTSDLVEKFQFSFWAESKAVLPLILQKFPRLVNVVHAKHTASVRYLNRLGFIVEKAEPFGKKGEDFHKFTMEVAECAPQSSP